MQGGFIAFLGTKDLDATHEFYSSVLGLDLVVDQNACRIYKVPGGGFIGFCEHLEVCRAGRAPILTLRHRRSRRGLRKIHAIGREGDV
jgi:catechol 2,3-dioxygenase-like lactoylglutathione lyase family enzyme